MVIRAIERQEAPGGDQAAGVAEHDVRGDSSGARCVGDDVGCNLGVAEGAEGERTAGDDEGCAVPHVWLVGGQEHDVPDHDEGCGDDEEDVALVDAPGEEGEEHGEEGADDVGGHGL